MDVAVLAGGRSPEHDVSLASASQVLEHLDRRRHRVFPVLLDRHGGFWPQLEPLAPGAPLPGFPPRGARGPLRPGAALDALLTAAPELVVFPVLHGPFGEDGTLQGMLELYDVPFVGSGCAASAVAMDKLRTREALAAAGVPLADAYVPREPLAAAEPEHEFARLRAAVGCPAFVKVDASGSTVGVARITSAAELAAFLGSFRGRFRRWFAERALVGEEVTVAVLGNTGAVLTPLPPVGIYPRHDSWFTHEAKYQPGATDELVPPPGWSDARIREVQELAVRCHEALVCDGMSRTDLIVTEHGPVVLEVNTIPGMTRQSLLPKAALAAGLSFTALLDRLLQLALARRSGGTSQAREADAPPPRAAEA